MVTPNSPNPQPEELISAWLDDAAPTDGSPTDWTDRVLSQADAADVCADYLRIGALLNPQRVAAAPAREDSDAFWQRLEGRLRDDVVHPHRHVASSQHPSPTIDPHASASNAAVFRWSAFGSLAAVVVVAGLWGTGMVGDTLAPAQLALQAPPAPPSTQQTASRVPTQSTDSTTRRAGGRSPSSHECRPCRCCKVCRRSRRPHW